MKLSATLFVFSALLLSGCGGSGSGNGTTGGGGGSGSPQAISGAWEFVAKSSTDGSTTLIEADLSASGVQTSASGPSQVQTATYFNNVWYVNGACVSSSPGQNSVSGTVSGNSLSVTFNEGGNVFSGQGTVSGTTVSGTYSGSSAGCSDSGTFTGTQVANLSGTFAGTLFFPAGADQVNATLTEGSGYSLTFQTTLSGTDNGKFTFSGSAVANVMFVSGTVNGGSFSLFGYFDKGGTYTGIANSIAVFDYNTLAYDGVLVQQAATVPPISVALSPIPPTSLVTSASQSLTAVVSNDSANHGVSWSVTCAAIACGSLSSATTASGQATTYTAPSSVPTGNTVTLKATSVSDPTKTASATITIKSVAAILVSLTGVPALLGTGSTAAISAVVSNDPSNRGVSWTATCASPGACGSFNPTSTASGAATTYTAPSSVPVGNIVTIKATSLSDATKSASATITISKAVELLADGDYVFSLAGTDGNAAFYNVAGVFTVSGGAITGGEQDFIDGFNTDLHDSINPSGSSYGLTADGNLQFTLTTCAGTVCTGVDPIVGGGTGIETIIGSIITTSTCGSTGGPCRARLVEFDAFATSSGTLDLQDSVAAVTAPSGPYAFGIQGSGIAIGGILNISGASVSTTGTVLDFNLAGSDFPNEPISTSAVSAPDATGRFQISITPTDTTDLPIVSLAAYIVDGSRIELMAATAPLGGVAYLQNTAALAVSGNSYVAAMTGVDGLGTFQAVGLLTMGSTGTVTGFVSSADLGNNTTQASAITSGTYVADTINIGRYTLTGVTYNTSVGTLTLNLQLYVDGNGNAVVVALDPSDVLGGVGYQQTASASFSGAYAMGDTGADGVNEFELDAVGTVQSDGTSSFSGFADLNWFSTSTAATQSTDLAVTGAFTAPADGLSTGTGNTITGLDVTTPTNADAFDYYVVDSTRVIAIETDGNQLTLGYLEIIQ
jgi:hypothetical protein